MMKDVLLLGAELQYMLPSWANFSVLSELRTMPFLMSSVTFAACRLLRKMRCPTWTSLSGFPPVLPTSGVLWDGIHSYNTRSPP